MFEYKAVCLIALLVSAGHGTRRDRQSLPWRELGHGDGWRVAWQLVGQGKGSTVIVQHDDGWIPVHGTTAVGMDSTI